MDVPIHIELQRFCCVKTVQYDVTLTSDILMLDNIYITCHMLNLSTECDNHITARIRVMKALN